MDPKLFEQEAEEEDTRTAEERHDDWIAYEDDMRAGIAEDLAVEIYMEEESWRWK